MSSVYVYFFAKVGNVNKIKMKEAIFS